jgi:hypothetical protein
MHVLRADGQYGVITGYRVVPGSSVMYNLEVQQDHTFVVGSGEWVVHNCSFQTFYAKNSRVFWSQDEAKAAFNTINRAFAGDKLWDVEGSLWKNLPDPGQRPPLPTSGMPYEEWTVNFGDTIPGVNSQRGGSRILFGSDGSIWFTRNHYGDWGSVPGKDFYKLWWR